MKTHIIIFFLLMTFTSCKRKNQTKKEYTNTVITDTIKKNIKEKISEIFIGKKFYEGDELVDYSYFQGGYLSKDSILTFSVYENNKEYIYSIESQISNKDVKEYVILDTLILKKRNVKDLKCFSYPLKNNKIISFFTDKHGKEIIINIDSLKIKK